MANRISEPHQRAIPNRAGAHAGPIIGLAASPGGGRLAYPLEVACCGTEFSTRTETEKEFVEHWVRHGWDDCKLYCRYCEREGNATSLRLRLRGRIAHHKNCIAKSNHPVVPVGIINPCSTDNASRAGNSLQCNLCNFVAETSLAGLMQHKRHCHAKELNDGRKAIPPPNKGMRWNDDKLLLMARCELALLKRGGVRFINIELERKLTEEGWTRGSASAKEYRSESIKYIRKTERYAELKTRLEREEANGQDDRTPVVSNLPGQGTEAESESSLPNEVPENSHLMAEHAGSSPTESHSTTQAAFINRDLKDDIERQLVELERNVDNDSIILVLRDIIDRQDMSASLKILQDQCKLVEEAPRPSGGVQHHQRERRPPNPANRKSRRSEKSALFKKQQKAFFKDPSKVVAYILRGSTSSNIFPPIAEVEKSYQETFNTSTAADQTPFDSKPTADNTSLLKGFSTEELAAALKRMSWKSAVGPDRIKVMQLRSINIKILQLVLNLWLLKGEIPDALRENRTILIPKNHGGSR